MKRIISLVLCSVFAISLSSCDKEKSILETEKIIAVEYESVNEVACEEYVINDFIKATYNSSSDVVLAVENNKADCGVLDEFELNDFIKSGRNIQEKERCEYYIDYCAYFSWDNEALQKDFNKAIRELKADGTFEKIKNAYLKEHSYSSKKISNENGTLTMLCDPSFKKRVYTDDSGKTIGLDVDIAREICNYLGYDLEIVTADFDELFAKLDGGEGDFIISACEINAEREEYYLASDTYFTLDFYLIEKK